MITELERSSAELIRDDPRLYLVHNDALESLLFDRNLMGTGFRAACLRSSRWFIAHLADEYRPEETAELVILSKGLAYRLAEAVPAETGHNLPTNLIATSRTAVAHDTARIEVPYCCFEAPAETLLIGDTVASGETIITALRRFLDVHPLRRVFVLSYAGTLAGATRIAEFCTNRGIEATFLYGLAAFGLGDNGFDLSFLHPDTVTRAHYVERAREQFSGRPVSAVGWDFGSQSMAPRKYRHLSWVESEIWNLTGADCFEVAEPPGDWSELAHERAAYEHALPHVSARTDT
ncbi:hypothetical protein [Actinomadura bangladeshensis]|uniref:Uncharacterized protein n=1 Tax=Actinomadura bangladeshensis TaxID=453573 RepID=A0A4R4NDZ2_9ACTN|nr:hypothetical protein [Actinomadura bangladeshensis]TDC07195.1 hypothetical protein E1284_32725 [Actinomadura bangladeshensis]